MERTREFVSFAGEELAAELRLEAAVRAAAAGASGDGAGALADVRDRICARMAAKGMSAAKPDRVLLTAGTRQAIGSFARIASVPGDTVLVENPTDASSLQTLRLHGLDVAAADSAGDGMDLAAAEELIKRRKPAFLYVGPTCASPAGGVWSLRKRLGLLALSHQYGVPLLEDNSYGELMFDPGDQGPPPSLYALDDGRGAVLHIGTLAKAATVSAQPGWVAGPPRLIRRLAAAGQAGDRQAGLPEPAVLDRLLRDCRLDDRLRAIAAECRARMEAMHALLLRNRRGGMRWAKPKGGFFLWLELPEGLDAEALLRAAAPKGIDFAPGAPFFAVRPRSNTVRLNYSEASGARMEKGIARFMEAVDEFLART